MKMKGYVVGTALTLTLQLLNVSCEITRVQKLLKNSPTLKNMSTNSTTLTLSEGEQIALEVTHQLLPPPDLSSKISSQLKLIKYKYRAVGSISHQRKWIPGQLISTRISSEQIRSLNSSLEYGPLLDVAVIDLLPFYFATILSFSKPYNPLPLGERLKFQYGFSSSPNSIYWDGDDIFYDASSGTYIFKRKGCGGGSGETGSKVQIVELRDGNVIRNEVIGCVDEGSKHYWEFVVDEGTNVPRLVKEYDIDADGNREFNKRYESVGI